MAVQQTHTTDAQTLAHHYAELVRDNPLVRELWTFTRGDVPELWVIADALSDPQQLALYELSASLHDAFPDALFDFHLLSPEFFPPDTDLRSILPAGAEQLQVHR